MEANELAVRSRSPNHARPSRTAFTSSGRLMTDLHATILHLLSLNHRTARLLPQRHRTPPDRHRRARESGRAPVTYQALLASTDLTDRLCSSTRGNRQPWNVQLQHTELRQRDLDATAVLERRVGIHQPTA